jgi:hypothetical protein
MERYTLFFVKNAPFPPPPKKLPFYPEIRSPRMERYTLFWGETPPSPPKKNKPSSAAKPIFACLYKTLTLMLYNLINHPNLMGARRSCGQWHCAQILDNQEETHLAMVSVPERDFFSVKNKNKVLHLFNRNFG